MLHGVISKSQLGRHKKRKLKQQIKMTSEQAIANEAIAKAVAEATRVAIQALAAAVAERPQNVAGPKLGRPAMISQAAIGRQTASTLNSRHSG